MTLQGVKEGPPPKLIETATVGAIIARATLCTIVSRNHHITETLGPCRVLPFEHAVMIIEYFPNGPLLSATAIADAR